MQKKILFILTSILMIIGLCFNVFAAENIALRIDDPIMQADGAGKEIDEYGTAPVIVEGRTLLPVRAVVEEMGGSVDWNSEERKVTLTKDDDVIVLTIDSKDALYNEQTSELDSAPVIINNRTMLPIRFIAESFGFDVEWNADTKTVNISQNTQKASEATTEVTTEQATEAGTEEISVPDNNSGSNAIVVYFSRAGENYGVGNVEIGNTAHIANFIIDNTGADRFEIIPEVPYPEAYDETTKIAQREKNENARPAYKGEADLSSYSTVYLGYPIWYGTMPMIVKTFLENNDLSGKTVIPFSTHAGSGWGSSLDDLKELCPDSDIEEGFSVAGTEAANAEDKVKNWLEQR